LDDRALWVLLATSQGALDLRGEGSKCNIY
jgi:hypothetical protein